MRGKLSLTLGDSYASAIDPGMRWGAGLVLTQF